MKKLALVLVFSQALVLAAAAGSSQKIDGWLDDQKCAGHKDTPNASCVRKCVEGGIPLVLVGDKDKKIYKVDKQNIVKEYAGQHVTITGTIDGDSLQVEKVDPLPLPKAE